MKIIFKTTNSTKLLRIKYLNLHLLLISQLNILSESKIYFIFTNTRCILFEIR